MRRAAGLIFTLTLGPKETIFRAGGRNTAAENTFVGLRHDLPTYTNVGIVNLHATDTVTYSIQFQYYRGDAEAVGCVCKYG